MNSSNSIPRPYHTYRFFLKLVFATILLVFAIACKKNAPGTGLGGGGATKLLTKVVLVGRNASNNVVESATTIISYDANDNFIESQFTETSSSLDITITTNEVTQFTYGASLISSLTESITTQTSVLGQAPYNINDSTYTNFHASGSQVDYFVSNNIISTTGFFPTTTNTLDSALVTYDANGYVSTYTVYRQDTVPGPYRLFYKQAFSYGGNNLAGYVLTNYSTPNNDVTTATYTYNNHNSASPFYGIIPGIFIKSANDVSELNETQTGINAGNTTYTYSTSYNSFNQPTLSSVLISMTPANASIPVAETINYYYQP
jgi:hypothetical protein